MLYVVQPRHRLVWPDKIAPLVAPAGDFFTRYSGIIMFKTRPTLFTFKNYSLRVITDQSNRILFVASDVCDHLDIQMDAISKLSADERSTVTLSDQPTAQATNQKIISESGFYLLVNASKKRGANKFKKWVTSEVLLFMNEDIALFRTQKTAA